MHISLPEELSAWAEQQARSVGYPTLDAYFEELIRRDQEEVDDWLEEFVNTECPPGEVSAERRSRIRLAMQNRIDEMLDEGLASGPATPMTARDWEGIRERVGERLRSRYH